MKRAHLICHTHWDREWYLTQSQFRPRLVRLIDGILDLAENCPGYVSFMLDGQTIALSDYLAIKPYNRPRLEKCIREETIIIGPWYILPDEMLISGESHIRNYLIGDSIAGEYGKKMQIGYLPDSFGHPEQMPQILRGLGMDATVFWRGAPNEMDKTEFFWTAPDGKSQVLCVNMPLGYSTAARLGGDVQRAVAQLEQGMELLGEVGSTDVLLLMNGSDHLLADRHVPEIIEAFNRSVDGKEVIFSTMKDFLGDLRANLPADTKSFAGNLCYGDKTILLGGTISTRMYLKQANHRVQKKLERYVEPVHSLEILRGGEFDFRGYQKYLWKLVLENHPHDSICGCSIDELHDEMETRFASLEQLEDVMLTDACERFRQEGVQEADTALQLYEPTQDGLPCYLEVEADFDSILKHTMDYPIATTRELDGELPPPPKGVRAMDEAGNPVPCVLLEAKPDDYVVRLADYDQPSIHHANRVRVALLLPGMEYGAHTLSLYRDDGAAPSGGQKADCIENAFYSVMFDRGGGSFTVTDRRTGKVHAGVHKFVDMGDAGDEYTYSWPDEDRIYTLEADNIASVEVDAVGDLSCSITVAGALRLPAGLTADRRARGGNLVESPVRIKATLYRDIDRIDFSTHVENMAKDHRLQVEFPVGTLCTHSSGSAAFAVTQHPIERVVPQTWEEYPQMTSLNHGFVDVGDGDYGISLASQGMTEYEAANRDGRSYLRLTLLRCVGWLSLPGLNTRRINGGWQYETPGGQCVGSHCFDYSIAYHEGSWQAAGTYAMADRTLHPVYAHQSFQPLQQDNPLAFLSQLPPLVRLSAVKPSERGDSVILRFFSLSPEETTVRLQLPQTVATVYRVSLAEEREEALKHDTGELALPVGFGEIISLELLLANEPSR